MANMRRYYLYRTSKQKGQRSWGIVAASNTKIAIQTLASAQCTPLSLLLLPTGVFWLLYHFLCLSPWHKISTARQIAFYQFMIGQLKLNQPLKKIFSSAAKKFHSPLLQLSIYDALYLLENGHNLYTIFSRAFYFINRHYLPALSRLKNTVQLTQTLAQITEASRQSLAVQRDVFIKSLPILIVLIMLIFIAHVYVDVVLRDVLIAAWLYGKPIPWLSKYFFLAFEHNPTHIVLFVSIVLIAFYLGHRMAFRFLHSYRTILLLSLSKLPLFKQRIFLTSKVNIIFLMHLFSAAKATSQDTLQWALQPFLADFIRPDIQNCMQQLYRGAGISTALSKLHFLSEDERNTWHDALTLPHEQTKMLAILYDDYTQQKRLSDNALISSVRMGLVALVVIFISLGAYAYWDIAIKVL